MRHHQRGELTRAKSLYQAVLKATPNHFDALHLSGVIEAQMHDPRSAVEKIRKALAADPRNAAAYGAFSNMGLALTQLGEFETALAAFDRSIALKADHAETHCRRGDVLRALHQPYPALASYQQALALKTDYLAAHGNCGVVLCELEQWEAAIACFDRAIAIRPDCAEAYMNRGNALLELRQWAAALESYDRAIAIKPDFAEAYSNRGIALKELRHWDAALASTAQAIAIRPAYASAHLNRGAVHHALRQFEAARDCFDQAIAISADYAEAHADKGVLSLQHGDFATGWGEYEWRWKSRRGSNIREKRNFPQPLWLGDDSLAGKTILLHAEQGLGDTLQFCRYAKSVAALQATVILEVQAPLAGLLSNLDGVSRLVVKGDPLPDFDCQCPLLSLPLAFRTNLSSIPSAPRYLTSDTTKRTHWEAQLGPAERPRIGLVWSGGTLHRDDHHRSIPLAELFEALPTGFEYVSLQKEVRDRDTPFLRAAPHLRHFADQLFDFTDTAALCDCLDLIISVDTSVAHLSAALGRKTWMLLPFNSDWRWLLNRNDTPWYPSMTLYRQTQAGGWSEVLTRLRKDLEARAR